MFLWPKLIFFSFNRVDVNFELDFSQNMLQIPQKMTDFTKVGLIFYLNKMPKHLQENFPNIVMVKTGGNKKPVKKMTKNLIQKDFGPKSFTDHISGSICCTEM